MRRSRKLPNSNSGAIADVSFLLLIFFMVVTTFNKDYKLKMNLPPYSDIKTSGPVDKNKVIDLLINGNNEIMIQKNFSSEKHTEFITTELMRIISKKWQPIVILKMHPDTDYQAYIELLAHINAAKNNCRGQLAQAMFQQEYATLPRKQQSVIEQRLKLKINEQVI